MQILTPDDPWRDERIVQAPFLVRKVYDTKPVAGAEFLGDIDWLEVFQNGVKNGTWDVEPTMDESHAQAAASISRNKRRPPQFTPSKRTKSKASATSKPAYDERSESDNGSDSSDDEDRFVSGWRFRVDLRF